MLLPDSTLMIQLLLNSRRTTTTAVYASSLPLKYRRYTKSIGRIFLIVRASKHLVCFHQSKNRCMICLWPIVKCVFCLTIVHGFFPRGLPILVDQHFAVRFAHHLGFFPAPCPSSSVCLTLSHLVFCLALCPSLRIFPRFLCPS